MGPIRGNIIFKSKHPDGDILIVERDGARYLYLGSNAIQSAMDLQQPNRLTLTYTQRMMAFLLFTQAPQQCLLLGLGGGALAKALYSTFPKSRLDAVELREDIISVAHSHFFLPCNERINIILDDAYNFTQQKTRQGIKKYDTILVDAYDQNGLAPCVKQENFYNHCHLLLKQHGVLAINMWATSSHQLRQHIKELKRIFQTRPLCLPVPEKGNIIVFVTHNPQQEKSLKQLNNHAKQLETEFNLPFTTYLKQLIKHNQQSWLQKFFN